MDPVHDLEALDSAVGKHVTIDLHLELDATTVLMAAPSAESITLGAAVTRIADDEPNRAVAMLMGAALAHAAVTQHDHAVLALGAALSLLGPIARSQLLGVIQ